jgi:hypothetical protein
VSPIRTVRRAVVTASVSTVAMLATAPLAQAAAPDDGGGAAPQQLASIDGGGGDTVATPTFSKSILGLDIYYMCRNEDTARTLTLFQSPGRPDGFTKTFDADCDGQDHAIKNVGAPSNTSLIVMIDDPNAAISVYGFK